MALVFSLQARKSLYVNDFFSSKFWITRQPIHEDLLLENKKIKEKLKASCSNGSLGNSGPSNCYTPSALPNKLSQLVAIKTS